MLITLAVRINRLYYYITGIIIICIIIDIISSLIVLITSPSFRVYLYLYIYYIRKYIL